MRSWSGRGGISRVAALATAGVLSVVSLGACSSGGPDVEVGEVTRQSVAEIVEAAGSVVARTQVSLRAPSAGTVDTLLVDSGDEVEAGDVLLTISSPAAEDALAAAEAALAEIDAGGTSIDTGADLSGGPADERAEAAFAAAEAAAAALPEGAARDAAVAQAESAHAAYHAAQEQAEAALERFGAGLAGLAEALSSITAATRLQAEATVNAARRTVEALTVRAPADGVVTLGPGTSAGGGTDPSALLGALPAEAAGAAAGLLGGGSAGSGAGSGAPVSVGAPVDAGGLLATVIDDSELSLRAEVDETDILAVAEDIEAEVEFDALPGATYPATVRAIDLAPTVSSRGGVGYGVTLSLGEGTAADGSAAPRPRPGMSAVVALTVDEVRDEPAVPVSAILRDGADDIVWVVKDGRVQRREVRLGAEGEDYVEIRDGVEVGEAIVIRGADEVADGDKV